MITEVTRYQTKDGTLHETEEDAEEFIVQSLMNQIGPLIDKSGIGFSDRIKVAQTLCGSLNQAKQFQKILNTLL